MDKTAVYHLLQERLNSKIENLEHLIADARRSNNETKSSMGDKYETSREMVQQEINKLQWQLSDYIKSREVLKSINLKPQTKVGVSTLVQTDRGWFFISVSLGVITYKAQEVFAVSMQSPVALAMHNKTPGESIVVNNTVHTIQDLY